MPRSEVIYLTCHQTTSKTHIQAYSLTSTLVAARILAHDKTSQIIYFSNDQLTAGDRRMAG